MEKFLNLTRLYLIFVFIYICYFCFYISIILKVIYFIKNKNIINYLLKNIIIIIIIYIKI